MADDVRRLTIGEVARQTGMRTLCIRYYESRGVLPPAERISGMRRYSPDLVRRLAIIDVASASGSHSRRFASCSPATTNS
jgi:DNA-binding transcriptional MerR regulator